MPVCNVLFMVGWSNSQIGYWYVICYLVYLKYGNFTMVLNFKFIIIVVVAIVKLDCFMCMIYLFINFFRTF